MSVRTGIATIDDLSDTQESGMGVAIRNGKLLLVAVLVGDIEWARECELDEANLLADMIKQQVREARGMYLS